MVERWAGPRREAAQAEYYAGGGGRKGRGVAPGAAERWALIGASGGARGPGCGWAWQRPVIGGSSRGRGGARLLGAGLRRAGEGGSAWGGGR